MQLFSICGEYRNRTDDLLTASALGFSVGSLIISKLRNDRNRKIVQFLAFWHLKRALQFKFDMRYVLCQY
jgi:hypothetical protein